MPLPDATVFVEGIESSPDNLTLASQPSIVRFNAYVTEVTHHMSVTVASVHAFSLGSALSTHSQHNGQQHGRSFPWYDSED
jgi:hypothetical protein